MRPCWAPPGRQTPGPQQLVDLLLAALVQHHGPLGRCDAGQGLRHHGVERLGAQAALQEGAVAQQQKAYQEDVLVGQEKAGLAANGVDVGSGSAVDILSDTKAAGELDQLTILNNAQRTSVGFTNQGINYGNQANINEAASQAALTGGDLAATSDVIKGAGAVASTWYNYTNNNSTSGVDQGSF